MKKKNAGKLVSPHLDDRTWKTLIDQTRSLIPQYNPTWTDHNPSDPGITLLELLAHKLDLLGYQMNRVPEAHQVAFLHLMGMTAHHPTPAMTELSYTLEPTGPDVSIALGSLVATRARTNEEAIHFETTKPISIHLQLKEFIEAKKTPPAGYTYRRMAPVDSVSLDPGESLLLLLGFEWVGSLPLEKLTLGFQFNPPPPPRDDLKLSFVYSSSRVFQKAFPENTVADGTQNFVNDKNIYFTMPVDWAAQSLPSTYSPDSSTAPVTESLFWIGIWVGNTSRTETVSVGFRDVGVHSLTIPSIPAINAQPVEDELVGISNGEKFQYFQLKHLPLLQRPKVANPYGHVSVTVKEPGGREYSYLCTHAIPPYLAGASHQNRYCHLDAIRGGIIFGDAEKNGQIPPAGSRILVSYRYVLGARSNVAATTLTRNRYTIPEVTSVTNPIPATGGSDGLPLEHMAHWVPEVLRTPQRAVTVADYEYLARVASSEVKKARCLPPRLFSEADLDLNPALRRAGVTTRHAWTYGGLNRSLNCLNVIIVPDDPDPTHSQPQPSEALLQTVSDFLEERRLLTTRLHVTKPRYVAIDVTATIEIFAEAIDNKRVVVNGRVLENTEADREVYGNDWVIPQLRTFLHPLVGGPKGTGWEVGQSLSFADLLKVLQPAPKIGYVSEWTSIGGRTYTPDTLPPLPPSQSSVPLADYELVCCGTITLTISCQGTSTNVVWPTPP